jgi:hypothetical protein
MRLLKLLAYSLLGYVLYELYLGMTEGVSSDSALPSQPSTKPKGRRLSSARDRSGKMTSVEDANGAHGTRAAGRGVAR